MAERSLTEPRTGHNLQFPLPDLFRQSDLQPPGGLRGYERRRTVGRGSDVADTGRARAEGDGRRAHLGTPLVRDRRPRGGAELGRAWSPQHRVDRAHGDAITDPAGDPRYR